MALPPPGAYRLRGTCPWFPLWTIERTVVVAEGWNVVVGAFIVPLIPTPDPLVPGPTSGFVCDGEGHFALYVFGVVVWSATCEPLPTPPPPP